MVKKIKYILLEAISKVPGPGAAPMGRMSPRPESEGGWAPSATGPHGWQLLRWLLVIFLLSISSPVLAKLKVVTTIPDFADLAQQVGGEQVEVKSLARGDQDPHYLEAKPSYALALNRADLLIHVGMQLEVGWLPVLLTQSRNGKIQPGQPGNFDASIDLQKIEIPIGPVTRAAGDVHPEGNPHYWLNPYNGLTIAQRIAKRLGQLDPENSSTYQENLSHFRKILTPKIKQWEQKALLLRGRKIITHHKSFSYLMDWLGLKVVGYIEPKPGIPPPPSHILSLIELIQREKIPLLITESYYDHRPARRLAKTTKAGVLILPASVGGNPEVPTYEKLFDYLINKIQEVL